MKELLCDIRGLSVTYALRDGTRLRAVDDLSLAIASGEVVGILGESGCGKSTLANALLRLLPGHADSEQGTILFRGRDLLTMPESRLREIRGREISVVSQDPALALNPVINVGSQISEVLRAHLSLRAKRRRARVLELLGEVGFDRPEEIYGAYPHQLSGGQRQRVAIAQAISCHPALLIADEPTSKLDAPLQTEIIALLAKIRREHGIAIVMISHDPAVFAGFADRVAVMYAGRVVEIGTTAQIFRQPLHPYAQALVQIARSTVAAAPATHLRFAAIEGDSPDPASLPAGCRFHPRCPDRMEICSERYPQVFLPEPSRPVSCFKYGE
ncbi:MAG: ABC transporter ATP-binding protein [Terriglobales bacterium]